MEVSWPLRAMARPGEKLISSAVTKRLYRDYLGEVGNTDGVCPRAWWRSGESVVALAVVFRADEAIICRNVTPQARTHPNQALTWRR